MPSNYETFDVSVRGADGTSTPLAGATVKVYDATHSTALSNLTTDLNGVIAAGTLSVAVGTRIRFRVENSNGLAGSITQVTT